jgi:hypothetical protein
MSRGDFNVSISYILTRVFRTPLPLHFLSLRFALQFMFLAGIAKASPRRFMVQGWGFGSISSLESGRFRLKP